MQNKLSENIKKFREQMGITQSQLAESLFVTPQSVSRWEKGLAYPDIEKLPQLSAVFEVSIDELLGVAPTSPNDITKKLIAARKKQDSGVPNDRIEFLNLLEKGFDIGMSRFIVEFFSVARALCNERLITEERFTEIVTKIKNRLNGLPVVHRNRILSSIVVIENEEKLYEWKEFITDDNNFSCWHDLILQRYYANVNEKEWSKQRSKVLFRDITKVLNIMSRKSSPSLRDMFNRTYELPETCIAVKNIIDAFSKRDDDIFISLRINAEVRLAMTYIKSDNFEAFYRSLERIKELISVYVSLLGKSVSGSTALFESYELMIDTEMFLNDFCEIEFLLNTAPCLNYSDEPKIKEFSEFINKEHGRIDPYCCIPYTDRNEFDALLKLAESRADKIQIEPNTIAYVFAAKTAKGNVYEYALADALNREEEQKAFINMLVENSDTQLLYMTGLIVDERNKACLEYPPHKFREALCDIDKRNLETKILVNGMFYYLTKSFQQSMSPYALIKYEQ